MSPIDLTTIASVDAFLNLQVGGPADALLSTLITAASQMIMTYCDRTFQQQPYTEERDGQVNPQYLTLGYPIISVQSVEVCGQSIPPASGWPRSGYYNGQWYIGIDGYWVPQGRKNVQLSYTAGYATIPADLAQACIELVALKYKQKDRIGVVGSMSIDGQSVALRDIAISAATQMVIDRYRRVTPIPQ